MPLPALLLLCCYPVFGVLLGGSVSAALPVFNTFAQPAAPFANSFAQPAAFASSSFSLSAPSFATASFAAPSFAAPVARNSFSWVPGQPITFGTPKPFTSVSAQKMDAKTLAKLVNADDLVLLDKPGLAATERLYDQGSFRNWNIEMAQKDIDAMNADPTAEKKFPCKVTSAYGTPSAKTFNFPTLTCRYKGSVGSLRMCVDENNRFNGDCRKLSWAIDTDGQKMPKTLGPKLNGTKEEHTIHGAKNIAFGGCPVDWSLMSERMAYSLLNALNVTAPVASHAKLFLNGGFLGVYSFVQPADTTFARERFLGDKNKGKGALYKQVWFNQIGMQKLEEERKGGSAEDDAYMRTIMATIEATPLTQDAALKMFTKYFDTKAFIDVTSLNSVIGATDDWRQRHNFYWYVRDGSTGKKVVLLPWDYDRLYDEQALRRGALGSNPWWDIQASATTYSCSASRMQSPEALAAQAASSPSEVARWADIFKTLPADNQVPVTCDKITKLLSLAFGAKVRARTREFLNIVTLDQIRNWFKTWNAQIEPALTYDPDGPTAFKLRDEQTKLLNHLTSARNLALAQANMADRPANAPLSTPLFRSG